MENLLGNWLGGVYETLAYVFVFLFLLVSLALGYVTLRQRDDRGTAHDPQLGLKVALHYFVSVCVLMVVAGAALAVGDLLQVNPELWSATQRTATALVVVGLVFATVHLLMLRHGTNNAQYPAAGRFFTGWRFAIHGFVVIGASAWLLALLLQMDPRAPDARDLTAARERFLYGVLLIWGPSWLIHLGLLWRYAAKLPSGVSWDAKD
jgi:heme/copper-type cytochrome/quinol oxidase subunit 2